MNNLNDEVERALTAIADELPPVIFRNWRRWHDVIPLSPRTLANLDSLKQGPASRVMLGNTIGYPKKAFVDFLRNRMKNASK